MAPFDDQSSKNAIKVSRLRINRRSFVSFFFAFLFDFFFILFAASDVIYRNNAMTGTLYNYCSDSHRENQCGYQRHLAAVTATTRSGINTCVFFRDTGLAENTEIDNFPSPDGKDPVSRFKTVHSDLLWFFFFSRKKRKKEGSKDRQFVPWEWSCFRPCLRRWYSNDFRHASYALPPDSEHSSLGSIARFDSSRDSLIKIFLKIKKKISPSVDD